MSKTVESYEAYFRIIDENITRLFFNDNLLNVAKDRSINYNSASHLMREFNDLINNDRYRIQDILLSLNQLSLVVFKEGVETREHIFTRKYTSGAYPINFWEKINRKSDHFQVYPAQPFNVRELINTRTTSVMLLPIVITSNVMNQLYFVVLVEADQLFRDFQFSFSESLLIYGSQGLVYGAAEESANVPFSLFTGTEGYLAHGDHYYFHSVGSASGLTYVNVVPVKKISTEVSRLTTLLIVVLILSVLISIAISIALSRRFNTPIRQIVTFISQQHPMEPKTGQESELQFIDEIIRRMSNSNRVFRKDLAHKETRLKQYVYWDNLRNIVNFREAEQWNSFAEAFHLVLYRVRFTQDPRLMFGMDRSHAYNWINEFIRCHMTIDFPESVTLQVEHDLIITIVPLEDSAGNQSGLLVASLEQLQIMFEHDRPFGYVTIACNPQAYRAAAYPEAYAETARMVEQRLLEPRTQFISVVDYDPWRFALPAAHEQLMVAHLREGQITEVRQLIHTHLYTMENKQGGQYHYFKICKDIVDIGLKTLHALNLEMPMQEKNRLLSQLECLNQIEDCRQISEFVCDFVQRLVQPIIENKNIKDPTIEFVLDFIRKHYHTDLSLEQVAGEINLTPNYLSIFFKEKTGMRFIDCLHDTRIKKAKELLISSDRMIQDIAEQVGYANPNSFIRMFKKNTGVSPGELRRRLWHSGARE